MPERPSKHQAIYGPIILGLLLALCLMQLAAYARGDPDKTNITIQALGLGMLSAGALRALRTSTLPVTPGRRALGTFAMLLGISLPLLWPRGASLAILCWGTGWALACGQTGMLGHPGRLLTLLLLLSLPLSDLQQWIDLTFDYTRRITGVAAYMLHYFGTDVLREGVFIHSAKGSIQVIDHCSGLKLVLLLVAMMVMIELVVPMPRRLRRFLPWIALGIGYAASLLRLCLLVWTVDNPELFEWLHSGAGSEAFVLTSMILLAICVKGPLADFILRAWPPKFAALLLPSVLWLAACAALCLAALSVGLITFTKIPPIP